MNGAPPNGRRAIESGPAANTMSPAEAFQRFPTEAALEGQKRTGIEVYTVPARETYVLTAMPLYIAREVVALWVYYLRPLWK
jgi:hypothetical protein